MRLFVAVALPAAERQRLALIGGGVPGARWLPAENLHLTLRFIGEADGHAFQDITAALQEIDAAAFDLRLSGVGYFGDKHRVRVLWAGVDGNDALRALQQRVETALVRAGLPPEGRKFHPHVTLARLRDAPLGRVERFLAEHGGYASLPFPVNEFVLFSSHLGGEGAVYRPEAEFPLREAAGV